MLLVVMAINLVALLSVEGLSKHLSAAALEVANCILGLLLAALAVETIINGMGDLLRDAVHLLRGMGVIKG